MQSIEKTTSVFGKSSLVIGRVRRSTTKVVTKVSNEGDGGLGRGRAVICRLTSVCCLNCFAETGLKLAFVTERTLIVWSDLMILL